MQDEKPRVLIVDDSRSDIRIVNENLKDHYTVLAATSGQTALDVAVKNPKPDVILMDVEMPEMNGYEACKKLKSDPSTADIDIIFDHGPSVVSVLCTYVFKQCTQNGDTGPKLRTLRTTHM